jgi:hypothetical protein
MKTSCLLLLMFTAASSAAAADVTQKGGRQLTMMTTNHAALCNAPSAKTSRECKESPFVQQHRRAF